jgi:tetratricopeptide (TPR) repeat protein
MADSRKIEELKRRVQQDPASIAFAALADEYRRAGQFYDAIETCRAGLQRHPAYISARVTLGRALLEVGEYDEAQTHLEQVLRSAPENLAAIRALADIHERRGDGPMAGLDAPAPAAAPPPPRVIPRPTPRAAADPLPPPPAPPTVAARPPAVAEPPRPVIEAARPVAEPTPEPVPPVLSLKPPVAAKPEPDPAALRLEAFLAAIHRARVSAPRVDLAGR